LSQRIGGGRFVDARLAVPRVAPGGRELIGVVENEIDARDNVMRDILSRSVRRYVLPQQQDRRARDTERQRDQQRVVPTRILPPLPDQTRVVRAIIPDRLAT
jgi:hypothetical protein